MFGNRKRKLQDEEESLVPHGLVWHATVEPTPEEVAKNEETLGYTVNYAQEIERARREQSSQSGQQAPAANPTIVPWWRVEQPASTVERPITKPAPMPLSAYIPTPIEPIVELPRPSRIPAMQMRPAPGQPSDLKPISAAPIPVQPIAAVSTALPDKPPTVIEASATSVKGSMALAAQTHALPVSEPVLYDLPTPRPQGEERLVPKSSEVLDALVLAFSRAYSAGKTVWLSMGSISAKAAQRARQTIQSLEFGGALNRAGKQGQNLLRRSIAKTNQYARTTGNVVGAFSRAGVSRVRQILARVRIASTTSSEDVMRPANAQFSKPSRARLALAASALQARIIAARQLSGWRLRRKRMAIDSRLWASMTLAAIAAIIALVIVSAVPHFAAKSLPSRLLNTNPSVDANVAAPAAAAKEPVSKATVPVRKTPAATSTQTTLSKTSPAKTDSSKSAANAKPKHAVYDDYVAPNTYKYYGTGSKSSR